MGGGVQRVWGMGRMGTSVIVSTIKNIYKLKNEEPKGGQAESIVFYLFVCFPELAKV